MSTNIDLNATDNIDFKEESYVAFLDVLGFKNMISEKNENKINMYFGLVNSAIVYLKSIVEKKEIGSLVISDSIILTVPCDSNLREDIKNFKNLCLAVSIIQQTLAFKDIWIRGAISFGGTYFNIEKNQIIGKGFINAYLLEEKMAIYPRVIIDTKVIDKLGFNDAGLFIHAMNQNNYKNWSSSILYSWELNESKYVVEKDLPLFIDYFDFSVNFNEIDNKDYVEKIIFNIKKNIYKDNGLYYKYKWVSKYLCSKLYCKNPNDINIKKLMEI